MTNLPSLGPHGEGWVAIQLPIFAWIGLAGWLAPGRFVGPVAPALLVAGAALILLGALLAIGGAVALQRHDALTAVPHPLDGARLVDSGVYGLVRHPIYGGLILGAFGWALVRASALTFLGAVALFVFFDLKRRREEAWLVGRFAGYAAYRARTRRLIPWIY